MSQWDEDRKVIEATLFTEDNTWGMIDALSKDLSEYRSLSYERKVKVKSDVLFISAARTRWPAALDAIAERDKTIAELRAEIERLKEKVTW
jgi:uncharacterized small protein (DUF1192 family)